MESTRNDSDAVSQYPDRLRDYDPLDAPEPRPRNPNSKRRGIKMQTRYDGGRFVDEFASQEGDRAATLSAAPEMWEPLGEHYTPVSDALIYASPLKPGPKLLLITLVSYLRAGGENTSYPGRAALAGAMNCSETTIDAYKLALEKPDDGNGAYLIWETGGWNAKLRRNETNSYHITNRYLEEHRQYIRARGRSRTESRF